jgi:acetate CoA/acetoacetate CoA-transferase beta subunit
LPLTSERPVDLIVTELTVLRPSADGLVLQELAPGVEVAAVRQATETRPVVPDHVPCMAFE